MQQRRHRIPLSDLLWFAVCMTAIVVIGGLRVLSNLDAIRHGERVCIPAPMLHVICSEDVQ